MELTFIDDTEMQKARRTRKYPWAEAISLVKANPNRWAKLPFTISNPVSAYQQRDKLVHRGLEVYVKKTGEDKKFEVFMRFIPPEKK